MAKLRPFGGTMAVTERVVPLLRPTRQVKEFDRPLRVHATEVTLAPELDWPLFGWSSCCWMELWTADDKVSVLLKPLEPPHAATASPKATTSPPIPSRRDRSITIPSLPFLCPPY
jgi:hypothetical protein